MNAGEPGPRWSARRLLAAPHRLGFFAAMLVLAISASWWAGVQLQRSGLMAPWPQAVPAPLAHAAVMTFGFVPLFFCGFLFTAGPRWLAVHGPGARELLPAVALQVAGWFTWLAAGSSSLPAASAGLACACAGLAMVTVRFAKLVRASRVADRLHAKAIVAALLLGCAALAGTAATTNAGRFDLALPFVRSGLWGSIIAVVLAAAHRMLPFFPLPASSRAPWHDTGVLALMLVLCAFESLCPWIEFMAGAGSPPWEAARGTFELGAGLLFSTMAIRSGLRMNLRIRLPAMLHLGVAWLGLGLVLAGAGRWVGWLSGEPVLPLAGLHAITIGCVGSLMMTMVTRVSCGHGGRGNVADDITWFLFWLLQGAALLRIAGSLPGRPAQSILTGAALAWAAATATWSARHGAWYGRPRPDGLPG